MPTSVLCVNGNCRFCSDPKCDHHCHPWNSTAQDGLWPDEEPDLPVRPYTQHGKPSSGYARGASTSEEAEPGRAGAQTEVFALLKAAKRRGLTGHEASDGIGKPRTTTGQAALSNLHKDGLVARLAEVRDRQKVYVLPEWVDGRETEVRGSHGPAACPHCGGDLRVDL